MHRDTIQQKGNKETVVITYDSWNKATQMHKPTNVEHVLGTK